MAQLIDCFGTRGAHIIPADHQPDARAAFLTGDDLQRPVIQPTDVDVTLRQRRAAQQALQIPLLAPERPVGHGRRDVDREHHEQPDPDEVLDHDPQIAAKRTLQFLRLDRFGVLPVRLACQAPLPEIRIRRATAAKPASYHPTLRAFRPGRSVPSRSG
ncbi:MAG: hypothetical protein ACK4KV_16345 [Rhodocyclaceae bacterium]